MRTLKYLLSLTLTLNAVSVSAGPKEDAKVAIAASHDAAKDWARKYLNEDLGRLMLSILQNPPKQLTQNEANLPQQIQQLNERIITQLDNASSGDQIDLKQLGQLVEAYRGFVRERFKASFEVQDLVYQRELTVRMFELPFANFVALCRSGRSAVGSIGDTSGIPRIPDSQYSFNMSYGTAMTGESGMGIPNNPGNNITFQFQAAGPNEAANQRNTVNNVLGAGASLSTSIAFSGAAGASVSMAMAAMPYLAAAYLAYSAFNYLATNQEQIDLQNEQARAKVDIFLGSATDRDIAKYYKDICANTLVKLNPLRKTIREFYTSDEKRQEILAKVEGSRDARMKYREDAAKTIPSQMVLKLAQNIKEGFCDDVKNQAVCKKSEKGYVLTQDPSLQLDPKSEPGKETIEAAITEMKDFDTKYPQETVIQYHAYEILETLYVNWNEISAVIQTSSFYAVDQAMNLLANKLQFFVYEAQKASNSPWAKSSKLLGAEQKLQNEFFSLREEYFKFLTDALKIFFKKSNAQEGKGRFKQFTKRFETFSGKTIVNPDVRAMADSVKKLGQFYEQL